MGMQSHRGLWVKGVLGTCVDTNNIRSAKCMAKLTQAEPPVRANLFPFTPLGLRTGDKIPTIVMVPFLKMMMP